MTRRTLSWSAALAAAIALLVAACSSSSSGSAAPESAGAPTSAPTTAPTTAISEAPSTAAESSVPSEVPSIEIPSFVLPSDDKGLEALLPDKLCGKTATKLSMGGDRFASVPDQTFTDTLSQLGKTPKDVSFAVASSGLVTGGDCSDTAIVFRVKGADPGRFRDVFIAAAKEQDNTTWTNGNVGGKDVYIGTQPDSDTKSYAWFRGDALFIVEAKDDATAAPLVQGMP
jgi:hypothetical protein